MLKRFVRLSLLLGVTLTLSFAFWGCGGGDDGAVVAGGDGTASDPQALFAGSAACQTCHDTIYGDFIESGHPYKLNKVLNDSVPTYPFSDIGPGLGLIADDNGETDNTLGTPTSYADVSYVIGGYGWKARWIDADGYIITGSAVQYNLENGSIVAYHNDETDKVYNCGNCHTTGWRHNDDTLNTNRQDDLPGMDGTFVAGGVQCESCHGPGKAHVASQDAGDIVRVATARTTADFLASDMGYSKAATCSECHTRDGEKDYPTYVSAFNTAFPDGSIEGGRIAASGGLGKHHEQFDELLGIDPDTGNGLGKHLIAGVTCNSCHDPHKTTKRQVQAGVSGLKVGCESCHGAGMANEITMPTDSYMKTFECQDCHMPDLAKSAIKHAAVGTGPATGDVATHIFKIDLTKTEQITVDGKFVNPWITKDYACGTCHNGVDAFDVSTVDFTGFTFHKASIAVDDTSAFVSKYANSSVCAECHAGNYSDFIQSGHPYKLNKVANDSVPTYPFSDIGPGLGLITDDNGETDNTLGTPASYADVSYVIGGYGWKSRWIDADGYIVTGSAVQYNLADGSMAAYHNDEADKGYNCGNCHTTGWKHYDVDDNPNRQDDLPGMDGTFVQEGGVQCESCHGAALLHVVTRDKANVTKVATGRTTAEFLAADMAYNKPVACGECHTRDGEHDYPTYVSAYETASGQIDFLGGRIIASGGFGKHHQQYDELLGIDPDDIPGGPLGKHLIAGVTCTSCHDQHATTKYQNDPVNTSSGLGVDINCTLCHTKTFTVAVHANKECIDCHMPKTAKSAIKTDSPLGADTFGDIRGHIFKIDLTKNSATEQFSGGFMKPWLAPDFACGTCHATPAARVGLLPGGKVH